MWSLVKCGYEELVQSIIRPMRAEYAISDLGPQQMQIEGTLTIRQDVQLKNPADLALECSWWRPSQTDSIRPCIIVLHGNSSCRIGALDLVSYAIPAGFTVLAFDFSGSGQSEVNRIHVSCRNRNLTVLFQGRYVSLGYHEQQDIETVVKYVRETANDVKIVLWGRSMGAVASLLYVERDPSVRVLVLDSPFSSFPQLAAELVDDGKLGIPKMLVKFVMQVIRQDIKRRAKFDILKLKPIDHIHRYSICIERLALIYLCRCKIPAYFMVGEDDELVGPHHVHALYQQHDGPKELWTFPGGHNSPRPMDGCFQALQFVRVMIGLLPLEGGNLSSACPSGQREESKVVYRNPLSPDESIQMVGQMSVKQLRSAIARAGCSNFTCIEKSDLIDLVIKLHVRYLRHRSSEFVHSQVSIDS